mmetsp:Transcript_95611/g.276196  ORF Transcript_95611/g.276196 Transcript_95611/m.276196 type:complete len:201 (-) Transcript_95611:285-887(-)
MQAIAGLQTPRISRTNAKGPDTKQAQPAASSAASASRGSPSFGGAWGSNGRLFSSGSVSSRTRAPTRQPTAANAAATTKTQRREKLATARAKTETAGPRVNARPSSPPITPNTCGLCFGSVASMTIACVMGMLPPERPATVRTTSICPKLCTPAVTRKQTAVHAKQPSSAGLLPRASEMRPITGAPSSCAKLKEDMMKPT